jgi:hypothetical protein
MNPCTACRHYRHKKPVRLIASGSGASPGRINAAMEEARLEKERRDKEESRLREESYRFDYEPHFHPWCRRYTPTRERLDAIKARLATGDPLAVVVEDERAAGYEFLVDAVRGEVLPVYALCERKNGDGGCPAFEVPAPEARR